ncbi:RidA family protein [Rhodoferax sediminis]|jgi:enamine deaminase RidA (YjgF/YER057c/UK114 family)|uniref:RidA family protein n=1 Tax=Rhodoferax sediminis TaxID=2509614 RepID=A0A515DAF2_9BURK|nr:RidA family protein [Rhodoferax sediminis]QDL37366.1 RidA family protein [Rhodoferax sediminis]
MALKQQHPVSPNVAEYPPGHWSNVTRVGDLIWLSGFTARANDLKTIRGVGSAYEQTKVIFQKVKDCLEAADARMSDIVNMTIYVIDMADNKEIWRARQEFFSGAFPCSTLVQVASLANPEIKLEIQCQAVAGSGA